MGGAFLEASDLNGARFSQERNNLHSAWACQLWFAVIDVNLPQNGYVYIHIYICVSICICIYIYKSTIQKRRPSNYP